MMGENPAAVVQKNFLAPETLTPEDILVVIARADWRISMMRPNARMEELGIFDDRWHRYLDSQGSVIGQTPIAREYFLNEYGDSPEWYIQRMVEVAERQSKHGSRDFLQTYVEIVDSYSREAN